MTYDEFVEFMKTKGAKSEITMGWMMKGCPKCKGKIWTVTSDGWAYCNNCNKGFSTVGTYTNRCIEVLDFSDL